MRNLVLLVRCEALPGDFGRLRDSARAEGYDFLDRLAARWSGNAYLEDRDACVIAALVGGTLTAIGAQTSDDHAPSPDRRRMRHFYVLPEARRRGTGSRLAGALIQQAFALAPIIELRATHALSRAFWESQGFTPITSPTATHRLTRG